MGDQGRQDLPHLTLLIRSPLDELRETMRVNSSDISEPNESLRFTLTISRLLDRFSLKFPKWSLIIRRGTK